MRWLARLEIDSEKARSEDIRDTYAWHQKLWECFPGVPEKKRVEIKFLTRIDILENSFCLWILAQRKPERPSWCPPEGFALKEIAGSFLDHHFYAFDLRANPTKCLAQRGPNGERLIGSNGKRKHGKRVPLVKPEELRGWLDRKAMDGGFRIVEDKPLELSPMEESHFRIKDKKNGREFSAYHGGVQFRGMLEVTDKDKFVNTYQAGIGSAKGFGFGLLLLAPINN